MQIVINIDEDEYNNMKLLPLTIAEDIIINGTVLPNGHGALKDIDKIISDGISKGFCDWYDEMECADTIIEADKEGQDETK